MKFTVLIGSYARGDHTSHSDIDVLRIGHKDDFNKFKSMSALSQISYIDFDPPIFNELYQQGSLFLFHAFSEGVLLSGGEQEWMGMKRAFVVAKKFDDPQREYLHILDFLDSYPGYYQSAIPYLSNVFKAVKNIGIFRLAEKGSYVFDKVGALNLGCNIDLDTTAILISANNLFERATPAQVDMKIFAECANEWKIKYMKLTKGLKHDL